MSKEFKPKEVREAIDRLKNLELAQTDLCKKCEPFKECAFRSALVATANLNGQAVNYFNVIINNSNNFEESCNFTEEIAKAVSSD